MIKANVGPDDFFNTTSFLRTESEFVGVQNQRQILCNSCVKENGICAVLHLSVLSNTATLWTVAHQFPLSMGFSRQEYWHGLLCLPPGDLPNPGIKPRSPTLQADSLPSGIPHSYNSQNISIYKLPFQRL
ncbi:unnamed protein product [Rangifer tarandus platyrhynchus]|uniref:Uncharacterized protein n=2 Tax=Rangifer tarandus platyrhynchus TaxID=3082113 RepID=A0AC59ZPQ1_RANTA|nr:unnamed protein product [Rangifer tarandus platyrhynchus]